MKCPFCGNNDTQVKDSRPSDDSRVIRRRRECQGCLRRFTTFERFQIQQIIVIKRDGNRELFDREKLFKSLVTALRKRPVERGEIGDIVSEIEQILIEEGKNEFTSTEIGDAALKKLKSIDFVGYIRYASVYNEFGNAEDFVNIIDTE